jgi:hypothetical protein
MMRMMRMMRMMMRHHDRWFCRENDKSSQTTSFAETRFPLLMSISARCVPCKLLPKYLLPDRGLRVSAASHLALTVLKGRTSGGSAMSMLGGLTGTPAARILGLGGNLGEIQPRFGGGISAGR